MADQLTKLVGSNSVHDVSDAEAATAAVQALQRWMDIVETASPEGQSVALRLAAARSLKHSGIMVMKMTNHLCADDLAHLKLRAALVSLVLLQVNLD